MIVDLDLIVRSWDGGLAKVTGVTADAACGRPLAEVWPALDRQGIPERVRRVLATGVADVLTTSGLSIGPVHDGAGISGAVLTVETAIADDVAGPALRDPDWRQRRAAVADLAARDDRGLVASVLSTLRREHQDFNVVSATLQLLALTNIDSVAPLVQLLGDYDADLRVQAALALGARKDPRATAALLGALQDPDANVRFHAIESLGRLGAREASEALANTARSGDFFLAFPALDALACTGDARIAPRLLPLLEDEMLGTATIDTLGRIGDVSVVEPLAALLDRREPPTNAVAQALTTLHDRARAAGDGDSVREAVRGALRPARTQRVLEAVSHPALSPRALAFVIGCVEGAAAHRSLTLLLGRPEARDEALRALVADGPLVVDILLEQLTAADLEIRRAAVVALGRIGDPRATPALMALVGAEPELLIETARALGRIADPGALDVLIPLLGHGEAAVRRAAIAAVAAMAHPGAAPMIARLLSAPDALVRESAARIAGACAFGECRDALGIACDDVSEAVRGAALEALPSVAGASAAATLVPALAHGSGRVREAAARALGAVAAPEAGPALIAALRDPSTWVRYFAARALGRQRHVPAVEALAQVSAGPVPHVAIAALEALGAIGGARAAEVLTACARLEDPEVAAAARRALASLGLEASSRVEGAA